MSLFLAACPVAHSPETVLISARLLSLHSIVRSCPYTSIAAGLLPLGSIHSAVEAVPLFLIVEAGFLQMSCVLRVNWNSQRVRRYWLFRTFVDAGDGNELRHVSASTYSGNWLGTTSQRMSHAECRLLLVSSFEYSHLLDLAKSEDWSFLEARSLSCVHLLHTSGSQELTVELVALRETTGSSLPDS